MEKILLENCIKDHLSIQKIAIKFGKSKTSIRYWLKKFKLKTVYNTISTIDLTQEKKCNRCGENKQIIDFYLRRNGKNVTPYCKICTNIQTIERQRKFKEKCISYKGGKCEKCDYKKCNAALEFHHIDPTQKDFMISNSKLKTFNSTTEKELDKCLLVCSNCHREIHSQLNKYFLIQTDL